MKNIVIALTALTLAIVGTPYASAAELPLEHHDCDDTISSSMKLANDLNCTGEDGLNIIGDQLVVDLNGHRIRGNGTNSGIDAGSATGATIRNGTVERFDHGVVTGVNRDFSDIVAMKNDISGIHANAGVPILRNVRAILNGQDGIRVDGSGIEVFDSRASRNGSWGIHLIDPARFVIKNVVSTHNNEGLGVTDTTTIFEKKIVGSTFTENNLAGVFVENSANISITGNTFEANGNEGLLLDKADNVLIKKNTAVDNGQAGFRISSFSGSDQVIGNIAKRNGGSGLVGQDSGDLTVTENTFRNNTANGIDLRSTEVAVLSGTVSGNTLNGNGNHGLLAAVDDYTIADNVAKKNGFVNGSDGVGLGFSAPVDTPGSGNVATGNDDSDQCDPNSLCA